APACGPELPYGFPLGLPLGFPAGGAYGLPGEDCPRPDSPYGFGCWFEPTDAGSPASSAAGGVCCCGGGAASSRGGGHGSPRSIANSPGVLIGGLSEGSRSPNSLNTVILGRFSTVAKIRSRSLRCNVSFSSTSRTRLSSTS